ncbi:MAG TPA: colicin D domain-containing protein [Mycobacterium sp.]
MAAEAAQESAFADLVQVRGLADVLHESSAIARRGAETLDSVRRSVLDAVEEADSAGYVVGEDLSVTPPRGGVAAAAQAQLYAASIQSRAAELVAQDAEIAAKITTATAPLNSVTFPETPARALGAGFKLDHQWDPYTDQPAHGPFEPVEPGRPQFDPKTGTVEGGGGFPPSGGKGGSGAGGKGGGGGEPPKAGPGGAPVPPPSGPSRIGKVPLQTDRRQIESKYKHAEDFGITDPRGSAGFNKFDNTLKQFVDDPATVHVNGEYRGNPAILNYNPETGLCVIQTPDGSLVSGFELSPEQLQHVVNEGKLGGGD